MCKTKANFHYFRNEVIRTVSESEGQYFTRFSKILKLFQQCHFENSEISIQILAKLMKINFSCISCFICFQGTRYVRWTDKQPLYFANWANTEPRLTAKNKSCAFMDHNNNFRWNMTDCSHPLPYVCKISTGIIYMLL